MYKAIVLPKGTKVIFVLSGDETKTVTLTLDHTLSLKGEELMVWEK